MSSEDRDRWNAKYSESSAAPSAPSSLLTSLAQYIPDSGRALDVAGGAGRNAVWLAQQGLDVTVADVSEVGLELARRRATEADVRVETVTTDIASEPLPAGPWDLIVSILDVGRPFYRQIYEHLARNGVLIIVQPTQSNLQRHEKPPREFLLDDGELPKLVERLDIVHYREGWLAEGRHDAQLVAVRRD